MAIFTGTAATDTFNGTDSAADVFRFLPLNLTRYDRVVGGLGGVNDTLEFLGGGSVTEVQMARVSGIEIVRLTGTISIELTDLLSTTSKNRHLTVIGSSGSESVYADSFTDASRYVILTTGGGNDTFLGSIGGDRVQIGATELTNRDFLNGGLGSDTLKFMTAGAVTGGSLANVSGFETFKLHAWGNNVTLTDGVVNSVAAGIFTVVGGVGNDVVNAFGLTGRVNFMGGDGANFFSGGRGDDVASGGTGVDTLNGFDGNDQLNGGDNDDFLYGESGTNTLNGGAGVDTMSSGDGVTTFIGGAESDSITVFSYNGGVTDVAQYLAITDGGADGDQITHDFIGMEDGDLRFEFDNPAFDTNGNDFDAVVNDDGTSETGSGTAVDGCDLVLYNDGEAGLTSTSAVDSYFASRVFAVTDVGVFLASYDNTTSITSIYYDADGHSTGSGAYLMAKVEGYSAATFALLGDNFALI